MESKNKGELVNRTLLTPGKLFVREAAPGEQPSRRVSGYAILFNTPSGVLGYDGDNEVREEIAPGAITKKVLDGCDIKLTMFHDGQLILGRSRNGAGTLNYTVDAFGVKFECEMPKTADGDKAIELVKRGDIAGCSFMFSTYYYDDKFVERIEKKQKGKTVITYRVKAVTGVYDFTLAADPAYPDTVVQARTHKEAGAVKRCEQIRAMRSEAKKSII